MPNSAPLISIIVPVYNAEDYLRYCIDSILQQSYTNLEVILVDDGAKDSSPAQRIHCAATRQIRLLEKYVYDAKIKNMK